MPIDWDQWQKQIDAMSWKEYGEHSQNSARFLSDLATLMNNNAVVVHDEDGRSDRETRMKYANRLDEASRILIDFIHFWVLYRDHPNAPKEGQ